MHEEEEGSPKTNYYVIAVLEILALLTSFLIKWFGFVSRELQLCKRTKHLLQHVELPYSISVSAFY